MTIVELNKAIRSFLAEFCPSIEGRDIIKGDRNRTSLPNNRAYIVFTPLSKKPVSVGTDFFDSDPNTTDPGTWTANELNLATYQVDIYGPESGQMMATLKTAYRSGLGAEYFKRFKDALGGVGLVNVTAVGNATEPDGTSEYAIRHIAELTVAVRFTASMTQEWTDNLTITIRGAQ